MPFTKQALMFQELERGSQIASMVLFIYCPNDVRRLCITYTSQNNYRVHDFLLYQKTTMLTFAPKTLIGWRGEGAGFFSGHELLPPSLILIFLPSLLY